MSLGLHTDTLRELRNRMIAGYARTGNKQAFGELYKPRQKPDGTDSTKPGEACALGALALGYDLSGADIMSTGSSRWWPDDIEDPYIYCPDKSTCQMEDDMALSDAIMHLNDQHRWSIPDIAEWLPNPKHRPTDSKSVYESPSDF